MCGIYLIQNLINGKCYIGQSIDIYTRWRRHKNPNTWVEKDYPLYRAFQKYGLNNFKFEILEECAPKELNEKEIYYIEKYNSFFEGYNQTLGSSSGTNGCGLKLSKQEVLKIIDLLQHSDKTMIEIGHIFHVSNDTISHINLGKSWRFNNIIYPIRSYEDTRRYCQNCGKQILQNNKTGYCIDCLRLLGPSRSPDRKTLKDLIRHQSFVNIGKQYGVSDNAVRNWCKKYKLPFRKSDIKIITDDKWEMI